MWFYHVTFLNSLWAILAFEAVRVLEHLHVAMSLGYFRRMCILFLMTTENHTQKKLTNPSFPTGGRCYRVGTFPSRHSALLKQTCDTCSVYKCVSCFFLIWHQKHFPMAWKVVIKIVFNGCVIVHRLSGPHVNILLIYVLIFVCGFFNDLGVNTCTRQNIFLAKTLWTGVTESVVECSTQRCGRCHWLAMRPACLIVLLGMETAGTSQPPLQPGVHLRGTSSRGSAGRGGKWWARAHLPPSQPLCRLRAECRCRGAGLFLKEAGEGTPHLHDLTGPR